MMGKWKAMEVPPRLILPRPVPKLQAPPIFVGGYGSSSSSSSSAIGRSEALKVHSQAEKRRRERINAHLTTLRRMVPDASKMDKASLLGSVIDHVKDLKRKVVDTGQGLAVPKDANHVTVEEEDEDEEDDETGSSSDEKSFYVKASICCEDRPDLFVSLIQTFHGLGLRAVRADIACLGGRVQNEFTLCGDGSGGRVGLSTLKEVLREALARVASFDVHQASDSSTTSSCKRQRLLQSRYATLSP
ncbi:transcription factor bHLH30-like [Iris pallida]|uniref:Transcription factor bHLH30-like n=1 Tax=Iris pallida TaxID=29817 RepID=A0AAX6I199_IRIPA|nr:transcription factor bHLH30-like [Iris pallida]